MLFTLITIVLIISFIAMAINRRHFKNLDFYLAISITLSILSIFSIILTGCVFLSEHVGTEREMQMRQIRYESLCKRLEVIKSDYEDVSKSEVIKDIAEWNQEVYDYKYWTDNIWTSWLFNKKIADSLEYIDYD